ncbi:MAG: SCP2 sterol-binding domain-containing protein [Pseudomonadota bacterium]|nr:SCP2 sterol-binding domain-containing protein [Pseudomonadota bacterium]
MNGAPPDPAGKPVFRPLTELLEGAGNTLLRLDPDSLRRLSALQGSVLGIEIREPELHLYLLPSGEGLRVERDYAGEADVTLRGTLWSFARLGREGMKGELFHDGSLEMSGNAELGQQYQQFLGQLDLDWEELLSRLLGDTPARKLGNLLRGLGEWATEAGDSAQRNLGEFLQEERRDLTSRLQSDEFIQGVDELRSDVERLAQRVGRLAKKSG